MAGLCDNCMIREARSPHDIFCEECEGECRLPDSIQSKVGHAPIGEHDGLVKTLGEVDVSRKGEIHVA